MTIDRDIIGEAAEWHAASVNDDMDWAGFTQWLEADPRHRAAYDEVSLADAMLGDHRESLHAALSEPAADPVSSARAPRHWWRWAGGAIAASLVALLLVPQFLNPPAAIYETVGVTRKIVLDDGSSILLAPHSRLSVESEGQQIVLQGGAWFDVRHDPTRQMTISAGSLEVRDIGTKFDIQASEKDVRIEVGEGQVRVTSARLSAPVALAAGRALHFDGDKGTAFTLPVQPGAIGEWRDGRLTYASTPLSLVAEDLSRYAGIKVTVDDTLRQRQFSGTLVVENGETALRDLSQLLGIAVRRSSDGYFIEPSPR